MGEYNIEKLERMRNTDREEKEKDVQKRFTTETEKLKNIFSFKKE